MGWPWRSLACKKSRVAGRKAPPLTGFYVLFWAGPWVVFKPPYLHAIEEVGPREGMWLATQSSLP